MISIHALLAESDYPLRQLQSALRYFYPRSPCGERLNSFSLNINGPLFLSTLSLRRATHWPCVLVVGRAFLSTLSLRRATIQFRDVFFCYEVFLSTLSLRRATRGAVICYLDNIISIHALLAESDGQPLTHYIANNISIHALLAESDARKRAQQPKQPNFYPRSPCGERQNKHCQQD